jgi:hypothetical protein
VISELTGVESTYEIPDVLWDKGYDYTEVYELLEDYGHTIHVSLSGEYRVNCKYHDTELDIGLLKELTPG